VKCEISKHIGQLRALNKARDVAIRLNLCYVRPSFSGEVKGMGERVESWHQLQARVRQLLDQIQSNKQLALAAAANPMLALEELGYEFDPQIRLEVEHRFRFGPRTFDQLRELRTAIIRIAGRDVDLNSADDLRKLLFRELKVPVSAECKASLQADTSAIPDTSPLPPQLSWTPKVDDPLERLRKAHPVMEPLLEYRRLEASRPRLAPRHLYEVIRQGKRSLPITGIRGRLKTRA
jgi:DNA polymerase I-like protein with 3'-5' exonuclease and polymerase domains